jgi:hypothetical protein
VAVVAVVAMSPLDRMARQGQPVHSAPSGTLSLEVVVVVAMSGLVTGFQVPLVLVRMVRPQAVQAAMLRRPIIRR